MRKSVAPLQSGLTAVEVLIVAAIVGVLATIGFVQLRPPTSRVLSNDLKAMVHQARYEAVRRNRPAAFNWVEDGGEFIVRIDSVSSSVAAACNGDTTITGLQLSEYPRAEVSVDMLTHGVVWLPTGQARTCTGAPMVTSSIEVSDGRTVRVVEITMGGKVTIE